MQVFLRSRQVDAHGLGLQCELRIHVEQLLVAANGSRFLVCRYFLGFGLRLALIALEGRKFGLEGRRSGVSPHVFEFVEDVLPFIGFTEIEIALRLLFLFDRLRLAGRLRFRDRFGQVRRFVVEIKVVGQGGVVVETQFVDRRSPGAVRGLLEHFSRVDVVRRRGQELVDGCRRVFEKFIERRFACIDDIADAGFILFVFHDAPFDAGVLDPYIGAGKFVEGLQQCGTLLGRDRLGKFLVFVGNFGCELGQRRVRLLGNRRFRFLFRQVVERVERIAAATATDLAGCLFQDLCRYSKCCAAIRALRVHCLALSPRTRQSRPFLAVLLPGDRFLEPDPGFIRFHYVLRLFT